MRSLLIACTLLLALAAPAAAQYSPDSAIVIREFDAELRVQPDGAVEVTERVTFGFTGQWRGILRDLSLQHNTAQGRARKLDVDILGVTDGAGQPLRWQEDDAEDAWLRRMRIYVPNARNNDRTVVIRYRVNNAIRFYFAGDEDAGTGTGLDFDELYWNATGNAWDMPIERARARIVLPPGVRPERWAVYTGPEHSTASEARVEVDSARGIVTFTSLGELREYEGMTVAAGWNAGAIAGRPTRAQVRRAEALRLWPLALPLFAFLLGLRSWRRRGRDPRPQAIVVGYEPPDGLSPAETGTLIDHKAETRDIISTLVDLAVRGHVGIEEQEEKKLLGLITETDYVFHQRTSADAWSALLPHERGFLAALFSHASSTAPAWSAVRAGHAAGLAAGTGDGGLPPYEQAGSVPSVRLSDLENKFYASLPGIKDAIYKNLVRRRYYITRPDKVRLAWIGMGLAVLVPGVMGAFMVVASAVEWVSPGALAVGAVLAALVIFVFGWVMPARTPKGARAREAALGFREFLARVESDRYQRMITSPQMFERYLPYAMAFGVEDRWASAFDDLYHEPPEWYSGNASGRFRASSFTSRMSSLTSSAGSTMSSSPSSSGSGGGGSSGGGSGGGGGSGF